MIEQQWEGTVNGKPVVLDFEDDRADGFTLTVLRAEGEHWYLRSVPTPDRPSDRGLDWLVQWTNETGLRGEDLAVQRYVQERYVWFRWLLGYKPADFDAWLKMADDDLSFKSFLRAYYDFKLRCWVSLTSEPPCTDEERDAYVQKLRDTSEAMNERSAQAKGRDRARDKARARSAVEQVRGMLNL